LNFRAKILNAQPEIADQILSGFLTGRLSKVWSKKLCATSLFMETNDIDR